MRERGPLFSSFLLVLWSLAVAAALLSGFAHLPLAYRYGLIDTWNTSPTVIHYWAAASMLLLGSYVGVVWYGESGRRFRLSVWGRLRVILVLLLAVTGIILILHNLEDTSVYGGAYAACKLGHLACAALFALFLLLRCCLRLTGRGRCVLPLPRDGRRGRSAPPLS